MRLSQVVSSIEARIPPSWAYEWDNCGLLVGETGSPVERIGVCLDVDSQSVEWALENGCQLLVAHHPAIFRPLRRIVDDGSGCPLLKAIRGGLAVYGAHTSWDVAPFGASVVLGRFLGLSDMSPMEPRGEWGLGVVGHLGAVAPDALMGRARSLWGLSWAFVSGAQDIQVSRVSICAGSGGELWRLALSLGAQMLITADVKYHDLLDAEAAGLVIGVVDHGEMEHATLGDLRDLIESATGVETLLGPRRQGRVRFV